MKSAISWGWLFASILLAGGVSCSLHQSENQDAYVDQQGVLRWRGSNDEVALLGVNYYTPFTVDYEAIRKLGGDHRRAILDDVAHLRRLGSGCIRVHCFDREFSDANGNFIDNHHVELLDFLISTCASNGLYTVLTPIAWWGGSYAPGNTHGFSNDYTMQAMTTDREAWKIQARFLRQFAEHVNRFTGKRYADDPAVLAFECINEPLYPKDTPDALLTDYINTLADALRSSGSRKPIYYNSWHGRNAAAGAARIDGVTASVYPTGLVAGHALSGSQLLKARGSSLNPDESIAAKSRMIYEFDAADVPDSYMYPSMAKFFRSESIQVAAQFQYDPAMLADVNHNWQTHHLNLIYTPGKALSLAVAAEVFKRVPRGVCFGELPEAATFPPFRSSDTENLSEMAADDAFIYSNTTETRPPAPEKLKRLWGCGSSPGVTYGGSGAYFLDRVASGIWRLQVYPDIFNVADAYTGTDQRKVYLLPGGHRMLVNLPDLQKAFSVHAFREGQCGEGTACDKTGAFFVEPGDYLLVSKGTRVSSALLQEAIHVAPAYVAPEINAGQKPLMRAEVKSQWKAGARLTLQVEAVSATNVTVHLTSPEGKVQHLQMQRKKSGATSYQAEIAPGILSPGRWGVSFTAKGPDGQAVWPDRGMRGGDWFFAGAEPVSLLRVPATGQALKDINVIRHGIDSAEVECVAGRDQGRQALRLKINGVGDGSSAAGFSQSYAPLGLPRSGPDRGLRVVARSAGGASAVELGFRMRSGQGLGCNLNLAPVWHEYLVPASEMRTLWGLASRDAFDWEAVESLSVLTGAWLLKDTRTRPQVIEIQSVEWLQLRSAWPLVSVGGDIPWSIFDADEWLRSRLWNKKIERWGTFDDQGRVAVHIGAEGFSGDFESLTMRGTCDGATLADLWEGADEDVVLHICSRAAAPATTAFELALMESGGVVWGTVVKLTPEWRTTRIPIKELRLFSHWDPETAKNAGPYLRLSRLQNVNVCFGSWLFPEKADQPHAVEISAIGITTKAAKP